MIIFKRHLRNKFILASVVLCLLLSSIAYSGSIFNSKHDMTWAITTNFIQMSPYLNDYGEVCVYCHTPHTANPIAPLWNRNTPPGPYTIYNISATMDAAIGQPNGLSLACLSCHDGATAVDAIINAPGSGANLSGPWYGKSASFLHLKMNDAECGNCHSPSGGSHDATKSYLTTDLSDDHPISMNYNDLTVQFGTEFNAPADTQKGWPGDDIKLYNGYVECSSCHDVHDPDITPFLRISNANSALCTKCHIK